MGKAARLSPCWANPVMCPSFEKGVRSCFRAAFGPAVSSLKSIPAGNDFEMLHEIIVVWRQVLKWRNGKNVPSNCDDATAFCILMIGFLRPPQSWPRSIGYWRRERNPSALCSYLSKGYSFRYFFLIYRSPAGTCSNAIRVMCCIFSTV